MRLYGGKSWKRTMLWSNSSHIQKLDLGSIGEDMKENAEPLAHVYIDKRGKKRCAGKKRALKQSQSLNRTTLFLLDCVGV